METALRAFIALELPETVTAAAARIQREMRDGGLRARWVRPEQMHLTLKFFEGLPVSKVDSVARCVADAARDFGSICLEGKGIGVFPQIRRPRVVWMGLKDPVGGLERLRQKLEAGLQTQGHPAERRPFKGHLTLGRFKENPDIPAVLTALSEFQEFQIEPFTLDSVTLFQSALTSSGSVYSILYQASL